MYTLRILANGEYMQGEDVELKFDTFEEVCKYAHKFIHSLYPVEISYNEEKQEA